MSTTDTAPATREQRDIPLPGLPGGNVRQGGQATSIEQSRAAAQVYAMVVAAHERPRRTSEAIRDMRDACEQKELAAEAFYSYRRGGENVSGATVQLARELARCWGNIEHGLVELSRDDELGESELLAFAWDLQSNTRSSHTFIVKHLRDTKADGPKKLTAQRDIYENNANNGARRVREAVFAVLPKWFREQAMDICTHTNEHGGGVPLQTRIAGAIDQFSGINVSEQRIEQRVGTPSARWTAHDVARLGVVFKTIQRGETTVDDEFPVQRVTADEIRQGTAPAADPAADDTAPPKRGRGKQEKATPEPEPDPRDEETDRDRSDEQLEMEQQLAQDGDR